MNRREELLRSLARNAAERAWGECSEACFLVLYGLPAETQVGLTGFMARRHLPIFERKWPGAGWPRQLLDDVGQWLARFGRHTPAQAGATDPADAAFLLCCDALLLACSYRTDRLTLTSSCACAVRSANSARQSQVWMADDPEALEAWQRQEHLPGRGLTDNVAALAVAEREWRAVATWLAENEVWKYPEATAAGEAEEGLALWKEHEMLLMVPRR